MLDAHYTRLMAEYNAWMNDKLYEACAGLSDEQRKQDRGAFFKSIHGTLNHLLWADRAFLIRLLGWPLSMGKPNEILFEDFAQMRAERRRFDAELLSWASSVEDGYLTGPHEFMSLTYKRKRRMPRYLMVVQMFNHQTHHRGQLTTLLTQLGIDIGSTDLPFMPYADSLCEDLSMPTDA